MAKKQREYTNFLNCIMEYNEMILAATEIAAIAKKEGKTWNEIIKGLSPKEMQEIKKKALFKAWAKKSFKSKMQQLASKIDKR